MGFIARFLAKQVLAGFIIGLGLFIAVGEIPKLVGITKPSADTVRVRRERCAQSAAIAKTFAVKNHEPLDANQELIGYGAANLGAGALQGYTVTGSLSKSADSVHAGGKTPLLLLVTSALVACADSAPDQRAHRRARALPRYLLARITLAAADRDPPPPISSPSPAGPRFCLTEPTSTVAAGPSCGLASEPAAGPSP